jgi:hypothetical protein
MDADARHDCIIALATVTVPAYWPHEKDERVLNDDTRHRNSETRRVRRLIARRGCVGTNRDGGI